MKPSEALAANRAAIQHVVQAHRARNARFFGSVLRGLDTSSSDLEILIDPAPETTLMDVAAIQVELQRLLGVPVDALTPGAAGQIRQRGAGGGGARHELPSPRLSRPHRGGHRTHGTTFNALFRNLRRGTTTFPG